MVVAIPRMTRKAARFHSPGEKSRLAAGTASVVVARWGPASRASGPLIRHLRRARSRLELLGDDAAERLKHSLAAFYGQDLPELIQEEMGRRLGPARGGTRFDPGCRMMTLLAETRAGARRTTGRDSRAPAARLWAARWRIDEV